VGSIRQPLQAAELGDMIETQRGEKRREEKRRWNVFQSGGAETDEITISGR
jgi:hypothetical protein